MGSTSLASRLVLLLLLSLELSTCLPRQQHIARAQALRINEPRFGNDDDQDAQEDSVDKEVYVRLPENVHEIIESQKADRARIHASILGLKPDAAEGEHLRRILNNEEGSEEEEEEMRNPVRTFTTSTTTTTALVSWANEDRRKESGSRRSKADGFSNETLASSKSAGNNDTRKSSSYLPSLLLIGQDFWSLAWEAHLYFSATLFVLLAIYCVINILRLHTFPRLFPKGYFISINLSLALLSVLRPVYLLIDPYNASHFWNRATAYLLLDTGFPCLSSAFAILFLALLRATQVELVTCQRARSLAIFCSSHLILSLAVDFIIGINVKLKYLILLCQGFFIVWSLLLSAGYFYIYSSMKKVSERYPVDLLRFGVQSNSAVKWATNESYDYNSSANNHRVNTLNSGHLHGNSPLCKAIKLTLGVALFGSLIGGVQLFGMIKMLGLQQQDLKIGYNKWAWLGYQISMRILEVSMATMIAVIATTPLTTESNSAQLSPLSSNQSSSKQVRSSEDKQNCFCCKLLCCCPSNDSTSVFREPLEEEIYSEICSNNRSVRNVVNQDLNLVYGTLMGPRVISSVNNNHSNNSTSVAPIDQLVFMAQQDDYQGDHNNARSSMTVTTANSGTSSSNHNSSTLHKSGESNKASEYSNRPSSMLYNEGGFVRFRMGTDPAVGQNDVLNQSIHDLSQQHPSLNEKSIRASQSFDESVLLNEQLVLQQRSLDPSINLQHLQPSPIYKSIESVVQQQQQQPQQLMQSSSELESNHLLYAARVPSRCSSVSATQSFDMRMYGKLNPPINIPNPQAFVASTLRRTEPSASRLENPYYYYGSTRNQKKKKNKFLTKPRPPLPSQRQPFELQQLVKKKSSNSNKALSVAQRQASLQHQQECDELEQQQLQEQQEQQQLRQQQQHQQQLLLKQEQLQQSFQRSRSLGGYYSSNSNSGNIEGSKPITTAAKQPLQSRGSFNVHQQPGSMTPMSFARWQHVHRHNNSSTAEQRQRQRHFSSGCQHDNTLDENELQNNSRLSNDNNVSQRGRQQQLMRGEIRGMMGNSGGQINFTNTDVLSPILTDHEDQKHHFNPRFSMTTTSSSSSSISFRDEKRIKNGSEAGLLADNEDESEASFVVEKRDLESNYKKKETKVISPLEYSARLKLQNQQENSNAHYSPLNTEQESQVSDSDDDGDDEHDEDEDVDDTIANDRQGPPPPIKTGLERRYHPLISPRSVQAPSFRWDGTEMSKDSSANELTSERQEARSSFCDD